MELWDIYDINRSKTGRTAVRGDSSLREVQAVKWASCDEILFLIDSGEFIPYYKSFINYIFDTKDHLGSIQEQR